MSDFSVRYDHDLYPGDLVALEFLEAASAEDGAGATYGDSTAVGDFVTRTDGTLSAMVSSALEFWTSGKANAGSADAITGWSATTPREYFDCFISDSGGGTGTWKFSSTDSSGSYVTGQNFAKAARGWYANAGYDATLGAVWSWLMGFTSNAAYESASDLRTQAKSLGVSGSYDPTLALATALRVQDASGAAASDNGSSYYDWTTVGLTCELASAQQPQLFADSKRECAKPRPREHAGPNSSRSDEPFLRGKSGLSFQMAWTETVEGASRRVFDVYSAALFGLAIRQSPKIYQVTDAQ